jgi:hypothetical protein
MEIDAGQTKDPKREAKLTHLQKEGRCFKCNQQGHLKCDCPEWAKEPDKPLPYSLTLLKHAPLMLPLQ